MQNINKKAISQILNVGITILISIAALSILALYLNGLKQPLLSPTDCLNDQLSKNIEIIRSCYNQITGEVELTIKRNRDDTEVSSLDFILLSGIDEELWNCEKVCGNCRILEGQSAKIYYIKTKKPDSVKVYANKCSVAESAIGDC